MVAPKLLHVLYESDVLSEEAILEWYDVVTEEEEDEEESNEERDYKRRVLQLAEKVHLRRRFHKATALQVRPFIEWLREAEEESDSE